VTWPGYLSITGDMNSYTFGREPDMFSFFRDPHMTNSINPSYWHEKAVAVDRSGGTKQFSREKFISAVKDSSDEWEVRLGDVDRIRWALRGQLLDAHPCDEREAHELVRDFDCPGGYDFCDFEYDMKEWSEHYIWCCEAIVWGIKRYDLVKEGRTQADHDRRVLRGEI
jgi:hypothetical protein